MTKPHKPPVRIGRSQLAVCFVLSVELLSIAAPLLGGRKDKFWEEADVSRVVEVVRRHKGGARSELECEKLIRLNFKYLYFNALQTDRFIGMPKPERVLERMSKIFSLAGELRQALEEARRLSDAGRDLIEVRPAARKIKACAEGIHDTVNDFFKEDSNGSFRAELTASADRDRLEEYLATCEQILSLLDQELERYFLNPSPGVVEVSTFRTCSVRVLSLSLQRLSLDFEKRLLD